ncbi:unnamed protein product [Ambrosiozyma monospora]|uniref:Unnamed protein product n=1 Tax=Ambrosiozyma monospora TaxID=43982 RepID=A0ACB5T6L7_AMBMO|nr:unnamed protein product [Ambrosiozyma monospora]
MMCSISQITITHPRDLSHQPYCIWKQFNFDVNPTDTDEFETDFENAKKKETTETSYDNDNEPIKPSHITKLWKMHFLHPTMQELKKETARSELMLAINERYFEPKTTTEDGQESPPTGFKQLNLMSLIQNIQINFNTN